MNAKKIRTAAAVVIALMILVYVGVSALRSARLLGIETETVSYGQVSDSLQAQGFAIRNETLVVGEYDGVISYRMADGTRVAKGGVIADVYQSEDDAAAWSRIERIDREVANLQALSQPADFYSSNTSAIGSQIYTSLNSLSAALRGGEFSQISQLKEDLQNALNRRQILISEETAEDFALHISELEGERAQLAASAGGAVASITAPVAGYFISGTDGLESVMAMDEVEDITPQGGQGAAGPGARGGPRPRGGEGVLGLQLVSGVRSGGERHGEAGGRGRGDAGHPLCQLGAGAAPRWWPRTGTPRPERPRWCWSALPWTRTWRWCATS